MQTCMIDINRHLYYIEGDIFIDLENKKIIQCFQNMKIAENM
jgi:hypothetical protein